MILDEITAAKRKELRRSREERKLSDLRAAARDAPPPRPFVLRQPGEVSIIAEIKRASPSRGLLRADLDPAGMARRYAEGGARAISVLTERNFFRGSPEDLRAAREAVPLPVLRKDFILEEYQLWETRVLPADAVLLIARLLEPPQLADYVALVREDLRLAPLVEIHDEEDLEAALEARAPLVGINNRDLDTFRVSLETTARLRPMIPAGTVTVSESGISTREALLLLRALGVDAALIGEELVCSADPARRIRQLRGAEDAHPGNPGRD